MKQNAPRTTRLALAALLATLAFMNNPADATTICPPGGVIEIQAIDSHVAVADRLVAADSIEFRAFEVRACGGGGGGNPPPPNPDRDGDGYTNDQETAQGTDPDDAGSFPDNKWTDAECDAWEAQHGSENGPEPCRGR